MNDVTAVVSRIDWEELRHQKRWLMSIPYPQEQAEGLLNLIDALQDAVVDSGMFSEETVFGPVFTVEDDQ